MPVVLDDSWTKYARGIEHLDALVSECDGYLRSVVVSAETTHNAEADAVEVRFRSDPPPPPRLGAIVGDIAHNLRPGLDVAAWQLAIAHDEDAARKRPNVIQFPLTSGPSSFKSHPAVSFFSGSVRAVIEELQPYQPNMEALSWLRSISNSDKHRIATFSFTGMMTDPTPEVGVQRFSGYHVYFGTDEGQIGIGGLRAIAATVESALRELEARCKE